MSPEPDQSSGGRAGFSTIHASAVLIGDAGVLIRGGSGAGKSTLARELVAAMQQRGRFARLVADDRVAVAASGGRLLASAVAPIAGLVEIRGVGLVRVPYEDTAVIRLVVDLSEQPERMPGTDAEATIAGVAIPRITVNAALALGVTAWRLGCFHDTFVTCS